MAENEIEVISKNKELMFLVDKGYSQYQEVGIEIPKNQYGLMKTYLWAAVAIVGANVWYYKFFLKSAVEIRTVSLLDLFILLIGLTSPILACIAFVLGIDTLRGRSPNSFPLGQLTSWKDYIQSSEVSAEIFYTSLLDTLSESIDRHRKPNEFRGKRLRNMSRLVIASAICGFVSGLYHVFVSIEFNLM